MRHPMQTRVLRRRISDMKSHKYVHSASLLLVAMLFLQTPREPSADDLVSGGLLFRIHCAVCHGSKGEGGRGPTLAVPKLLRAPTEQSLINLIRDGIPGTEMPRSGLNPDHIKQVAAWVRQLGQKPAELVTGNAQHGERLYLTKGACIECHAIKGRGGALGPDLTDIGLRRGASYLRTALTNPKANVPEGFRVYQADRSIPENFVQVGLVTKDGQRITGVRLNEDAFSIQVRDISNRVHSFFKSELIELHKYWGKSPMPGYADVFSKEELDDIVAYLVSLRGEE